MDEIKGIKIEDGYYKLPISWLRYEEITDSWKPLDDLYNEIPILIDAYIQDLPRDAFRQNLTTYLDELKSPTRPQYLHRLQDVFPVDEAMRI